MHSIPALQGLKSSLLFLERQQGVTHLSIGVIIYLEGLSVRHPKGACSIGIGHPRSGDRCTKALPYPLDPLWVADQSLQRPRQGVAHTSHYISATLYGVAGSLAVPDPRVVGATPLDPGLKSGYPYRGASFHTLHDELDDLCKAQMRHLQPFRDYSLHSSFSIGSSGGHQQRRIWVPLRRIMAEVPFISTK